MDKNWMRCPDRFSNEYGSGVDTFIDFACQHNGGNDTMLCPCQSCMNLSHKSVIQVRTHLLLYGIQTSYTKWLFHGEQATMDEDEADELLEEEEEEEDDDDDSQGFDMIQDLIGNIHQASSRIEEQRNQDVAGGDNAESKSGANGFDELLRSAQTELYPGCQGHSKLSAVLKLVHLKDLNHWSNKSFDMMLKLLKEFLPTGDSLPSTYYEAKKMLRDLGLGYESIDACVNDCVLFWKENEHKDNCPVCKESRWKTKKGKSKRVPQKVLRYFPLIPRLQRLFMNKEIASDLRYHSEKRVVEENVLRHPADGERWKDMDRKYPWLAEDPRHLRLALATDGFNPFGHMSSSHTVWPVIIVVYNLPPWRCTKEPFLLMTLLIPGKKSPGRNIDVYLRPVVEELKQLFNTGVSTFDACAGEPFNLRAVLLCTIHDLPALGSVFGYIPMGYKACPVCLDDTYSEPLRSKIGYLGHRRYLPIRHRWRKSNAFNGKPETGVPKEPLSGNQIYSLLKKLDHLKGFEYGKNPENKKRKASDRNIPGKNFNKMSILFELPYWKELNQPHNLDVMHIEKNIAESLFGTLLNIKGKSKDTLKARKDLEDLQIRKELYVKDKGKSVEKPRASYTLTRDEKDEFFRFIEAVCFPDGFAANISKGVSYKEGKITGLKSQDYHILLQRILPIGMRGFVDKNTCDALLQLGSFFRQLCSKTLKLDVLEKLEKQIVIVLCKLEMILPPAFFDITVHLAVHLPQQARLGGPVQFRWMYFIERFLGTLKGMVSNKAHPEGSIAEAYVTRECSTFCSMYLHGIEARFNRQERNFDGENQPLDRFFVFSTRFRPFGHKEDVMLTQSQYDSLSWYVLNNCEELQEYLYEHEDTLLAEGVGNILDRQRQEFGSWLRQKVTYLRNEGSSKISDCLNALAVGPHKRVHKYSGCIVAGVRFVTKDREQGRSSQNSGVCTEAEHRGKTITYYGVLTNVYVLDYPHERHVALFECEWYDLEKNKLVKIDNDFVSINIGRRWYTDDSFVLAGQVNQVFYVPDTKLKGNWQVVQKFVHRHLFDQEAWKPDNESEMDNGASEDIAFQEEEATDVLLDESFEANMLCRNDVGPEIVSDPTELASLQEKHVCRNDYDEELEP